MLLTRRACGHSRVTCSQSWRIGRSSYEMLSQSWDMYICAIRIRRVWRRNNILSRPAIACGKHCPICRQDPLLEDLSIYTPAIACDVIRERRTSKQIARCWQGTNCGEVDQSLLTRETANRTATWQARPPRKSRGPSARVARQRMPSPHGSALSSHHARRPPSIASL
jgi:hypothetical protein